MSECPNGRLYHHEKWRSTVLTDIEKTTALKIVLSSHDPEEFGTVNDRLCREFPNIVTDDLIALYREAGERQMAEADALEAYAAQRRAHCPGCPEGRL